MRVPLTKKVEGFKVEAKSISQLLSEMGKTAYQGRKLAEAVDLWEKMVKEDDLVIVLGLAGSMSTAGQWTLVNWLIKNRFVDVIVSTGANVSEDIIDAMGLGYWQITQTINDEDLLEADINRYYDICGMETDYRKMEELLTKFLLTLKTDYPYSSMEILHLLGKWLSKKKIESITATAAENGIPIFSPAMLDSSRPNPMRRGFASDNSALIGRVSPAAMASSSVSDTLSKVPVRRKRCAAVSMAAGE